MNKLQLVESRLYESRRDAANDSVVDAGFVIGARQGDQERRFTLRALTPQAYDAWYDQYLNEGGSQGNSEDVFPLVISSDYVAVQGLIDHVQHTYLDPTEPTRINDIAQFLVPADELSPAA